MNRDNNFVLNLKLGIIKDLFVQGMISEVQKNKCMKLIEDEHKKSALREAGRSAENAELLAQAAREVS